MVMARSVPRFGRSCHANSETLPKEVSCPEESWRRSSAAPGVSSLSAFAAASGASFFSGGYRRMARYVPVGLKENDSMPSTTICSPVERLRRPSFLSTRFLSFFILRLGVADGVGDPKRVWRKNRLRAERGGLCSAVGDVCDTQLVFTIGTVDAIREPPAVRREAAEFARHGERFPLAVFGRLHGRFCLCVERSAKGKCQ